MLAGTENPLGQEFDAGLYDLDGVCYRGAEPVDHAASSIAGARSMGLRPLYVTNNASRPASVVADQLRSLGIEATADDVYTAARAASELAQELLQPGASVYIIGGEGLHEELAAHGFQIVDSADDHPAAVVQGFDRSITWYDLSEGALAIQAGAIHIASNMDATLPAERGIMLANGSLVKAVENATGVKAHATGKPTARVFHQAAQTIGATRPLAIGDRLDTDVAGGINAGFATLHVLTGIATAVDVAAAPAEQRPTYIGADLRCLLSPQPTPVHDGQRWHVGDEWAEIVGGKMETSSLMNAATEDLYRAIVCACWDYADHGGTDVRDLVSDLQVIDHDSATT